MLWTFHPLTLHIGCKVPILLVLANVLEHHQQGHLEAWDTQELKLAKKFFIESEYKATEI